MSRVKSCQIVPNRGKIFCFANSKLKTQNSKLSRTRLNPAEPGNKMNIDSLLKVGRATPCAPGLPMQRAARPDTSGRRPTLNGKFSPRSFVPPRVYRSAELHSAVSQNCILRGLRRFHAVSDLRSAMPSATRRNSRLQICATRVRRRRDQARPAPFSLSSGGTEEERAGERRPFNSENIEHRTSNAKHRIEKMNRESACGGRAGD